MGRLLVGSNVNIWLIPNARIYIRAFGMSRGEDSRLYLVFRYIFFNINFICFEKLVLCHFKLQK